MVAGMKRAREEEVLSLALSLTTDSSASSPTTSADSAAAAPVVAVARKRVRRGRVVATSGEGEFVCKTCGRAFETFQALGGHRTSHLRGSHGLELGVGVGVARAIKQRRRHEDKQQHDCHICGLGFESGQALGGHMRRHRDEMALSGAIDRWVALSDQEAAHHNYADRPPVLLELFV